MWWFWDAEHAGHICPSFRSCGLLAENVVPAWMVVRGQEGSRRTCCLVGWRALWSLLPMLSLVVDKGQGRSRVGLGQLAWAVCTDTWDMPCWHEGRWVWEQKLADWASMGFHGCVPGSFPIGAFWETPGSSVSLPSSGDSNHAMLDCMDSTVVMSPGTWCGSGSQSACHTCPATCEELSLLSYSAGLLGDIGLWPPIWLVVYFLPNIPPEVNERDLPASFMYSGTMLTVKTQPKSTNKNNQQQKQKA